jgi:hypothetical protein
MPRIPPNSHSAATLFASNGRIFADCNTPKLPNLKLEIDAIQERVDPTSWAAIHGVRSVGNIGAHMEQDVNLIIDVDSGEAAMLIWLIETLIDDWYVNRFVRQGNLQRISELAAQKNAQKD